MIPAPCPCGACARLAAVLADHEAAIVYGDPALCLVSRTTVRLVAIVVDARHDLNATRWVPAEYAADAADGLVLPFADPVGIARRMTP
jgi:hypothetical protein